MTTRRFAMIDLGEDARRAFGSMVEILNGRTRTEWEAVDAIEAADVVVAGFSAGRSTLPDLYRENTPVLAIVESGDLRPHTPYVLTHPFRVMQVLSVLDELADIEPRRSLRVAALPAATAASWEFAASLRALAHAPVAAQWLVTRADDGAEVMVSGNLRSFACDSATLARIRGGRIALSALEPATTQLVPARQNRRAIDELLWYTGCNAGAGLAPWLDALASFRLRRWPDFGFLRPTRAQLQIVAALAARAQTRSELARAVEAPKSDVDRILNALSLCDLLAPTSAPALQRNRGVANLAAGFVRSLIGSLRKTLHAGA